MRTNMGDNEGRNTAGKNLKLTGSEDLLLKKFSEFGKQGQNSAGEG